jgi:hypothetical protein
MFTHEKTFSMARIKKDKNGHVNSNVTASKFVFFTEATKKCFFSRNFVNEHKMSMYIKIFFFEIFNILKYVFW